MKIVDQNIFFSVFLQKNLLRLLKYNPDVLCLQEFSQDKYNNISQKTMNGYYLTTPKLKNQYSNAFFSKQMPINWGEIHLNEVGEVVRDLDRNKHDTIALWIDIKKGNKQIRVYNCHLAIDNIGFKERENMLLNIIKHAKEIDKVLIIGDMNTTIPKKGFNRLLNKLVHKSTDPSIQKVENTFCNLNEKYYFENLAKNNGFTNLADINANTWRFPFTKFEICNLKLDWVLSKNIKGTCRIEKNTPIYQDHKTLVLEIQNAL